MAKLQSRMRSRLNLGDPESVSAIQTYTAAMDYSSAELRRTNGDDRTGINSNPNHKQSPYQKCWEETPWSALTGRGSQLEISQQAYVEKSQQAKTTMWIPRQVTASTPGEKEWKVYPEETRRAHPAIGDDKGTEHRADVKCTYKCTDFEDDQCDYKCTGKMMRSQASVIYAERVQLCLPKQFRTRTKMISERTK